jgi:hypothetical protein
MEESPSGDEGDGLPPRAEGLGLISLSSVDGSAGSSLGGTDLDTSEAAVVAMKKIAKREDRVNYTSAWRPAGVSDAFSVGLAARRCF